MTMNIDFDPVKAREEYNAYQREYRKTHRETIRAINARYWAKKAEERRKAEEAGNSISANEKEDSAHEE